MARKSHDDALGVIGAETVIGTGVSVQGDLASDSDIMIDGDLTGSIKAGGDVTIGINAHIKGGITGANVTIAGDVRGNIKAEGEAAIRETGHLVGDIDATGLAIASGGVFIGRSLMQAPPRLDHHHPTDDPSLPPPGHDS
jgi:cytoskeletal protein CcmA (bactofilin family)